MIIQHGDVRLDDQGQSFYAKGMRDGVEAARQSPGWSDKELVVNAANKGLLYMLVSDTGAVEYANGFEKGYRAKR